MNYEIKPYANLRLASLSRADLRGADLRGADLRGANLWGANLNGANLRGADLWGADLSRTELYRANLRLTNLRRANLWAANVCEANLCYAILWGTIGDGKRIKSIQTGTYHVNFYDDLIQIGCENYSASEWFEFDDDTIDKMEKNRSLAWWREWKPIIKTLSEKLNS